MCTTLLYQPFCAPLFVNNSLISIIHASLLYLLAPFASLFGVIRIHFTHALALPHCFPLFPPWGSALEKFVFVAVTHTHTPTSTPFLAPSLSHALSHSLSIQWNVYKVNHHRAKENSNYSEFFRENTFVNIYIYFYVFITLFLIIFKRLYINVRIFYLLFKILNRFNGMVILCVVQCYEHVYPISISKNSR